MRHALGLALAVLAGPAAAAEPSARIEAFGGMTRLTLARVPEGPVRVVREGRTLRLSFAGEAGEGALVPPALAEGGRIAALGAWRADGASGLDIRLGCACEAQVYGAGAGALVVDVTPRAAPERPAIRPATQMTRDGAAGWGASALLPASPRADAPGRTPLPRAHPRGGGRPEADGEAARADRLRDAVARQLREAADRGVVAFGEAPERVVSEGCPDEAALDLVRRVDASDFRAGLGPLRAALYDDMRQVSPAAVRALARYYLAFGMGEEAGAVLGAFGLAGEPERLIAEMAAVLREDAAALEGAQLLREGCGRRAAVWRAAASGNSSTILEAWEASEGSLHDLPGPLRRVLGGRIALALLDAGAFEAARPLVRSIEQADGPAPPELAMMRTWEGESQSLQALAALATARSPYAPEAAVRAAALALRGGTVPDGLRGALEDHAFIHRDRPIEGKLRLALALLDARDGKLGAAIATLDARIEGDPARAPVLRRTLQEMIRSALLTADLDARPGDIVPLLEAETRLDDTPESDAARLALAERLVAAGAAHLARPLLERPGMADREGARMAAARAALSTGDPRRLRAALDGMAEVDAGALREAGAEAAAAAARRRLVERLAPLPDAADPPPPLGGARRLLEDALADMEAAREVLDDG